MSSSIARSSGMSTAPLTFSTGPAAVVLDGVGRCIDWLRYRRQIRRTIETLEDFDDHLLADLGLRRDQIEKAARIGHLPGYPKR
jgi:uncharacterized protein YjiS (DUF1127 family)